MTTALDDPDRWRSIDAALHGFFHTKVADPQARADLVQDVLLRIHERRDQLRDEDRLEAWAFRVARNALFDHYRRRHPSEELPELAETEPEPTNRSGEILGAWLRTRIEQLPESYREAIELTEVRGLSQREAADALGVPYSTFKSRVQRGRDLLHAELLGCCSVELDVRGRVTDFEPRSCKPCGCTTKTES
jgi:RNA polymerase sigma-70 factor (ECF subfamily)